jgi:N-acetylmuramoyl-L-alanine amidase
LKAVSDSAYIIPALREKLTDRSAGRLALTEEEDTMYRSAMIRKLMVYSTVGMLGALVLHAGTLQGYGQSASSPDGALQGKLICIDAGHGGAETGAVGVQGLEEKAVNLTVATYLKDLLEKEGAQVIFSRPDDEAVGIIERAEFNVRHKSDLFVSIHHNANAQIDRTQNRTELFYHYKDLGGPSEDAAREVLREVEVAFGLPDSKAYCCWAYGVLRRNTFPAILGEASYISNPQEEARLRTEERLRSEANAYFKGIKRFFEKGTPLITVISPVQQSCQVKIVARVDEPDQRALIDPTSIRVWLADQLLPSVFNPDSGMLYACAPQPMSPGKYGLRIKAKNLSGNSAHVLEQELEATPSRADMARRGRQISPSPLPKKNLTNGRLIIPLRDEWNGLLPDGTPVAAESALLDLLTTSTTVEDGQLFLYFNCPDPLKKGSPKREAEPLQVDCDLKIKSKLKVQAETPGFTEFEDSYTFPIAISRDEPTQLSYTTVINDARTRHGIPGALVCAANDEILAISDRNGWFLLEAGYGKDAPLTFRSEGYWTLMQTLPSPSAPIVLENPFDAVLQGKRIIVDPEFGGEKTGERGKNGIRASDVNLRVAHFLADYLRGAGATVIMTRESDKTMDNVERVIFSLDKDADYYITIGHRAPFPGHNEPLDWNISRAYWKWEESQRYVGHFPRHMVEMLGTVEGNIMPSSTWEIMHAQKEFNAFEVSPLMMTATGNDERLAHIACNRKEALSVLYGFLDLRGLDDARLGKIAGSVVDARTGKPIADAYIVLNDTLPFQTENDGKFLFKFLRPGTYRLTARALNYKATTEDLKIVGPETATATIKLSPQAGVR